MSRILFLYNNLIDAATITGSSEYPRYPDDNVQHEFRTKTWNTTAGAANLVIDYGAATKINCVALANYSWTSAPATLDLEFNGADAWGAPAHTEALTWAAHPTANGNNGIIIKTFADQTYEFNRLNVSYGSEWQLGRIFLGTYFEPTDDYLLAEFQQNFIDLSASQRTPGGSLHVDRIDPLRAIDFSFIAQTQAQWESFQAMINEVGTAVPFFIAFDYDNEPDEMTIYGRFTKLPDMRRADVPYFRLGFTFEEAK